MNATAARRPARAAPAKRRARAPARPPAKPTLRSRLSNRSLRRAALAMLGTAMLLGAGGIAAALGVPAAAGAALGEGLGALGFEVKRVEITGVRHMDRVQVYSTALDGPSTAMANLDLPRIRADLLRHGWVRDAQVSRRLPDTLVVKVAERVPVAVWQHRGRLALVDAEGVVLDRVSVDKMPDLPLVIGPNANERTGGLQALLGRTPQLQTMLSGATWVGGRRWDLRFHSGETLSLPEGQAEAEKALRHFARVDKVARLLGRGLVRFDMRIPGKLVVRMSDEPGASLAMEDTSKSD